MLAATHTPRRMAPAHASSTLTFAPRCHHARRGVTVSCVCLCLSVCVSVSLGVWASASVFRSSQAFSSTHRDTGARTSQRGRRHSAPVVCRGRVQGLSALSRGKGSLRTRRVRSRPERLGVYHSELRLPVSESVLLREGPHALCSSPLHHRPRPAAPASLSLSLSLSLPLSA
eukprot:3425597-Rhodomonas_salina.1